MTETLKAYDYKTSFFYLVLKALKCLHGFKKTTHGASLNEIVKYFKKNYNIPGDLKSQVRNALESGEEYRFIKKNGDKYILVSPVATLQLIPPECKSLEMERVQRIFQSSWWHPENDQLEFKKSKKKRKPRAKKRRKSKSCDTSAASSATAIKCNCGKKAHCNWCDDKALCKPAKKRKRSKSCKSECATDTTLGDPTESTGALGAIRRLAQKVSNQFFPNRCGESSREPSSTFCTCYEKAKKSPKGKRVSLKLRSRRYC